MLSYEITKINLEKGNAESIQTGKCTSAGHASEIFDPFVLNLNGTGSYNETKDGFHLSKSGYVMTVKYV